MNTEWRCLLGLTRAHRFFKHLEALCTNRFYLIAELGWGIAYGIRQDSSMKRESILFRTRITVPDGKGNNLLPKVAYYFLTRNHTVNRRAPR